MVSDDVLKHGCVETLTVGSVRDDEWFWSQVSAC